MPTANKPDRSMSAACTSTHPSSSKLIQHTLPSDCHPGPTCGHATAAARCASRGRKRVQSAREGLRFVHLSGGPERPVPRRQTPSRKPGPTPNLALTPVAPMLGRAAPGAPAPDRTRSPAPTIFAPAPAADVPYALPGRDRAALRCCEPPLPAAGRPARPGTPVGARPPRTAPAARAPRPPAVRSDCAD